MRNRSRSVGLGLFAVAMLLPGCKRDAQFSSQEMQQLKQGPPKEMPPQARQHFEQRGRAAKPEQPGS